MASSLRLSGAGLSQVLLAACVGGPAQGLWAGVGTFDSLESGSDLRGIGAAMTLDVGAPDAAWPLDPCGLVLPAARAEDPNALSIEDASCAFEDLVGSIVFTTPLLELLFVAPDANARTGTLQVGGEGEVALNADPPVAAVLRGWLVLDQPSAYGDPGTSLSAR